MVLIGKGIQHGEAMGMALCKTLLTISTVVHVFFLDCLSHCQTLGHTGVCVLFPIIYHKFQCWRHLWIFCGISRAETERTYTYLGTYLGTSRTSATCGQCFNMFQWRVRSAIPTTKQSRLEPFDNSTDKPLMCWSCLVYIGCFSPPICQESTAGYSFRCVFFEVFCTQWRWENGRSILEAEFLFNQFANWSIRWGTLFKLLQTIWEGEATETVSETLGIHLINNFYTVMKVNALDEQQVVFRRIDFNVWELINSFVASCWSHICRYQHCWIGKHSDYPQFWTQ